MEGKPISDNDSQENMDSELAAEPSLKAPTDKSTQAERLIQLAHEFATFFHTFDYNLNENQLCYYPRFHCGGLYFDPRSLTA